MIRAGLFGWLKCKLGFHNLAAVLYFGSIDDWEHNYIECNRCHKRFPKGTDGIGWGIVQ